MARLKKAESADRIWKLLEEHIGGLPTKMILLYADMALSQFRNGLDYIRDLFQEEHEQPIITDWIGGECIYILTEDKVQRRAYAVRRKRAQLQAAKRDEHNANAAHLKWPDDKRVEAEAHRCRFHRASLEMALAELEAAA